MINNLLEGLRNITGLTNGDIIIIALGLIFLIVLLKKRRRGNTWHN